MDDDLRKEFMIAAAAIGHGNFRRQGGSLRDFLQNRVHESDTATDVGAKIIEYFCIDDGKFNGFVDGVRLAITFLDAVATWTADEAHRRQSLKDLKHLLSVGDMNAIHRWVDTNYR